MRASLIPEVNRSINPIMDIQKLRNFTSTFKRHTIYRYIRPQNLDISRLLNTQSTKLRQSASDYIFVYTRQVLPKIEEKIELQLLQKFSERLQSAEEKKEVLNAYYQRKDNLAKMTEA